MCHNPGVIVCNMPQTDDEGYPRAIKQLVRVSHLNGEDVGILDKEGLYPEPLAECCCLVDGSQGHSLVRVEAAGKVRSVRGEGREGEGRGGEGREERGGKEDNNGHKQGSQLTTGVLVELISLPHTISSFKTERMAIFVRLPPRQYQLAHTQAQVHM